MNQDFKLTIPNPCSQNWNEMSESNGGRYCQSCNKCVHDFTNFTDEQLRDYFAQASDKACGRFTQNQIDRFYTTQKNPQHGHLFYQLLVSAALTLGLVGKAEAKEVKAQTFQVQSVKQPQSLPDSTETSSDSLNYISGNIVDSLSKEPVPFATVSIKETNYNVLSDIDGNFKLLIPGNLIGQKITLQITCLGYEKKEMFLTTDNLPVKTEAVLIVMRTVILGGYEIIVVDKPSLWQRIFHGRRYKHQ